MRKNAVRKWLHAILDLLPLFVIPIFAINIINRSPEPLTVEYDTTETETVINYKYQSNDVNSLNDIVEGNIYYCEEFYLTDDVDYFDITVLSYDNLDLSSFTFTFDNFSLKSDFDTSISLRFLYTEGLSYVYFYVDDDMQASAENEGVTFYSFGACNFIVNDYLGDFKDIVSINAMTIQASTFNVIESVETVTTGTVVTYNDTDIGSQFVYSLYHTVNTYFNFGNIFGMTGIYLWFVTNFFSGNAPLVVPIIWNIIVYEFIMDILFIIYHLFMMLIDFTDYLLDKPFDSVKRKR